MSYEIPSFRDFLLHHIVYNDPSIAIPYEESSWGCVEILTIIRLTEKCNISGIIRNSVTKCSYNYASKNIEVANFPVNAFNKKFFEIGR